jgi:hypothetical protein
MVKMKARIIKILYLMLGLILIPIGMGLNSCSTDWLEPKPLSIFTPENAFVDTRGMYASLTACEAVIRDEWFTTGNRTPINTENTFSEVSVDGSTDQTYSPFNLNLVVVPSGSQQLLYINWYWQNAYKAIKYANLVITRIDVAKFANEAERNAVLGMAYFHRSYWYYRLTHQFGDVPFIGKEVTSPRLDFYSTKREVILRKIKKDMEFAAQWCSDNVDRGRATKGACAHLLTKINLALGEFDDAIASASSVIDGGVYSLMKNPFGTVPAEQGSFLRNLGVIRNDVVSTLHWPANKAIPANKEVLFLVLSREDLTDSQLSITSMYRCAPFWSCQSQNMMYTPDGYGPGTYDALKQEYDQVETFGRGMAMIRSTSYHTKKIWDDPSDLRHKKYNWMDMEYLVYNHPATKKSAYYGKPLQLRDATGKVLTADTVRNWFGWPHYKLYVLDPRRQPPRGGAGDWYVYRLAETYLLRAEAYWWKGDVASAMADVNAVRTRAKCAPYTDQASFNIGTILDERARELFWEEMRKTELTRISFNFAQTGKQCYNGKVYTMANISTDNFFLDRINEKNDFYNKGVKAINGVEFTIGAKHILWPIQTMAIEANTQGQINQNFGYDGYEKNVPALTEIPAEEDN